MAKFKIYHATAMDHSIDGREKPLQVRHYVGTVAARSYDEAFEKSNNIHSNWHPKGVRSTSIGDVIYDVEEDEYCIVMGVGFMTINEVDLGCKPIRELDEIPKFIWHQGHRYDYSPELAAIIAMETGIFQTTQYLSEGEIRKHYPDEFNEREPDEKIGED